MALWLQEIGPTRSFCGPMYVINLDWILLGKLLLHFLISNIEDTTVYGCPKPFKCMGFTEKIILVWQYLYFSLLPINNHALHSSYNGRENLNFAIAANYYHFKLPQTCPLTVGWSKSLIGYNCTLHFQKLHLFHFCLYEMN